MKKKNILILIIISIVLFIGCYFLTNGVVTNKLRGDSGFDTSYDSGSSWDSGSSYDSGSSWDSDSWSNRDKDYSSSSSSSGSSSPAAMIFVISFISIILIAAAILLGKESGIISALFFLASIIWMIAPIIIMITLFSKQMESSGIIGIILFFVIYIGGYVAIGMLFKRIKNGKQKHNVKLYQNRNVYLDVTEKYKLDYNKLLNNFYDNYITVQNAWMNFDYDVLKEKLTDELYNQYVMQLDTLKVKNQVNVMNGFKKKSEIISDIYFENNKYTVYYGLVVEFYDYIVEKGKVVRGTKHKKVVQCYEMVFVLDTKTITNCPNCGQDISEVIDNKCPSCHSNIILQNNNWKLSKKRSVSQSYK